MRRLLVPALAATAVLSAVAGCSVLSRSDRSFVADAAAARIYHEDRYERACVDKAGPPTCGEMRVLLQEWKRADEVANTVQKLGAVPPEEKKEIAALIDKVRRLP